MTAQLFRVRFTEWQAFALDVRATSAERAIEIGRTMHDLGTIDFEERDGGTDGWHAEPLHPPKTRTARVARRAKGGAS